MIAKYLSIRPSLHLAWLRYSSVTDSRFAPSSRLARRAHRRPRCTRDFTITALAGHVAVASRAIGAGVLSQFAHPVDNSCKPTTCFHVSLLPTTCETAVLNRSKSLVSFRLL